MSTDAAAWTNFQEAREAIEAMPLPELEAFSANLAPRLLPYPGWTILLGGPLLVVGLFARFGILALLGGIVLMYGIVALNLNGTRVANFRQACYRAYVQGKAQEMDEG